MARKGSGYRTCIITYSQLVPFKLELRPVTYSGGLGGVVMALKLNCRVHSGSCQAGMRDSLAGMRDFLSIFTKLNIDNPGTAYPECK